jgi:hypothetical protein
MLCAINPSRAFLDTTQNTLAYATRAKNIRSTVVQNDVHDDLSQAG